MAKDYNALAKSVVETIGGEENIASLTHCVTRLRFKLKDESKADDKAVAAVPGVLKVLKSAGQYQVVIGPDVADAYKAVLSNFNIQAGGAVEDKAAAAEDMPKEKKKFFDVFVDTISGIFMPFMGAFAGVGLLKGILALLTTLNLLDKSTTTYTILYAAADGMFYFLPIFLAYTAGKKFGANPFVSMCIAAAMLYPNISALQSSGEAVTFLGIPVTLISYSSTVLPIIVATYAQSWLEKGLNKIFPKMIRGLFVPMLCLIIIVPLSFIVIGPVTDFVGSWLAKGIQWLLDAAPAVGGFLIAALWPVMIIFGIHWGVVPIVMNNHATLGYDMILPLTVGCNFGIAFACLAVFLRTRNREMKQVSGSSFVSALVGGITEPGVYGVLLKYKKIFAAMCLFNGIGGIIGGIAHMTRDSMISVNVLTLPAVAAVYGPISLVCIGVSVVGTFLATYLFLYRDMRKTEIADIGK